MARPGSRSGTTLTVLAKFFLFCTAMTLFSVLLYIPVYNKANNKLSESTIAGWSKHTIRDPKIYVQPNIVSTIHTPRNICPRASKDKLFLLIVVCSSTLHFERRVAIRETWGNYRNYHELSRIFHEVKQRYIGYNYTYDLYSEQDNGDIPSFTNLGNEEANEVLDGGSEDVELLLRFDKHEESGENPPPSYDYYDKNPEKVLYMRSDDTEYKVVFLLGLPTNDKSTIQNKIEEESEKYGDVIQEGFIDSYSNLTLKSIMMLKWITNNCNDSVRYILKTNDNVYVNLPNLIENLRNRSQEFDSKTKGRGAKEYLLIGDLKCRAKPVLDPIHGRYTPTYMYMGHVYPNYVLGTGYVLSADAAKALYPAALRTDYFHLEDIFITDSQVLGEQKDVKVLVEFVSAKDSEVPEEQQYVEDFYQAGIMSAQDSQVPRPDPYVKEGG